MIHEAKVRDIKDIDSLITFLKEDLNWQLPEGDIADITFDWTGTELNLSEDNRKKLKGGCIRQLQNFRQDQPWGIFIVDFAADKILITPVRDMLRALVSKKRGQNPEHTSWDLPNLLFICLYGKDGFSFAHFKGDKPYGSPLTTFSWHPGDPIHTVCEYNLPALEYDDNWENDTWVIEWQKSFDVEAVNKLFYREIAELYYRLTGKNKHEQVLVFPPQDDRAEDKDYEEFAVRLIGRTIFCWFLKHKKSPPPFSLPLIPPEVLSLKAVNNNADYYHSVLEPLFFEVMNKEKAARLALNLHKSDIIPFLNGGLFESHPNDFYQGTPTYSLKIPDAWFVDFFTVLERYNFTIDENSSINIDVSVDPEMLGRVFENLLAEVVPETGETARKATGSYYTPRVIVDYMVEQSLQQYLLTKTALGEEKITALLTYGDDITGFTPTDRLAVVQALTEIKIIDPACGSGAFPIGILHRMLMALEKVDPKLELWQKQYLTGLDPMVRDTVKKNIRKSNWAYIRKLMIIRDCIYGVDIQPIAVEISKLRCFLSLVVDEIVTDEDDNRGIESLPNLEFKFVAANTLIGLPAKIERQGTLGVSEHIKTLKLLRDEYLRSSGNEKKEVEKKFRQTQKKLQEENEWLLTDKEAKLLAEWDPFSYQSSAWFAPEWMFGINDGFDIVIANPPYIQLQKDGGKLADLYKNSGYTTFKRTGDIYTLFYERGIGLLRNNGFLCLITSNKWMRAGYGKQLRETLVNYVLRIIIDFCELPVFAASTDPCIVLLVKTPTSNDSQLLVAVIKSESDLNRLSAAVFERGELMIQTKLKNQGWALEGVGGLNIIDKIQNKGITLEKYVNGKFYRGILTGLNEAFVIDEVSKNNLINEDAKSAGLIKPWLDGHDILRWYPDFDNKFLIEIPSSSNHRWPWTGIKKESEAESCFAGIYPAIFQYLYKFKTSLRDRDDQGQFWWELRSCSYWNAFDSPKIVFNETSKKLHAFVDEDGLRINKTGFIIVSKENEYLLGVMNSKLMDYYYRLLFPSWGDPWNEGRVQFRKDRMISLPIFSATSAQKAKITDHVKQIIAMTKLDTNADISKLERQIDELIYQVYGLTQDEIALIERKI